jgi:4-hydroxy-tetrahydrodipicolinate synthase
MKGIFSPVVTPFRRDLSPDPQRLAKHCRWLLANDVGLAVFGTNSEANSMSVEEKLDLLDFLAGDGIDTSRMMPGTGCCALTDSVALTTRATKLGCRGVLMLPPFYYKGVSDEGLFSSFAEVIERTGDSGVRVYLYNIPPVSQIPLSVGLIARLIEKYPDNVVGIKDSSGDWNNTKAYLDNFASSGFEVFPGAETFLLQGLRSGAAGCISATANVNPAAISCLLQSWESADADNEQAKLDVVRKIFASYPMIPALKAAIAHYGNDPEWATVRPPLVELDDAQRTSFISDLDSVGFSMRGLLTA